MPVTNVYPNSADAVKGILDLHFPEGTIVDVNWGHGGFYARVPDRQVLGVDIRPTGHIIVDNRDLPLADNSIDIGVVDPPYKRGDGYKYEERYGKAPKTETQVTWSYHETIEELLRVVRGGLIIKVQDGTDGHRFHPRHIELAEWMQFKTGLRVHDIAYVVRSGVANTIVQGNQHFFQSQLSCFLVYKWTGDYRPVRF